MAYNRVMQVVDIANYQFLFMQQRAEDKIKKRVDLIINILENYYEKNKDIYEKNELKRQMKSLLEGVLFDSQDEYIFTVDLKTNLNIVNKNKNILNKNMYSYKDDTGKYIFKKALENLKENSSAFQEIEFPKPSKGNVKEKKLLYYSLFKPYDWMIGTGLYYDDLKKKVKSTLLKKVSLLSFPLKEYIFIHEIHNIEGGDNYATMLLNKNLSQDVGKYLSTSTEDNKDYFFRKEFLELAKNKGEGFVTYEHRLPRSLKTDKKTSFVYYYKDWNWLIGSGFYYIDMQKSIDEINKEINKKINNDLIMTFYITLFIVFTIIIIAYSLSKKLNQDIFEKVKATFEKDSLLKTIYDKSDESIFVIRNREFYDCNEKFLNLFGFENKKFILGKGIDSISTYIQSDTQISVKKFKDLLDYCTISKEIDFPWLFSKSNGETFTCTIRMLYTEVDGVVYFFGFIKE